MTPRPTRKSSDKFEYFLLCEDENRLPSIEYWDDGYTALECFHALESWGELLPCREPKLLSRAMNGKHQHGITVTMIAEDYIDRLIFACEIDSNYPAWVSAEIYARAGQIAEQKLGFRPTFIRAKKDFTTL